MTSLILQGSWFGQSGLYEAQVSRVEFLTGLAELENIKGLCFIVVSYDLSAKTLQIPIKTTPYPSIICCHIEGLKPLGYIDSTFRLTYLGSSISDRDYMQKVETVRSLISRGTIYQANLTNRFDFVLEGEVRSLASAFFHKQPVPFAFCLSIDEFFILSGSMELFLSRTGKVLRSMPIKGTAKEAGFLEKSKKDQAENLMITDMMRNDIGRVAKTGSVRTTELFKITAYETLYQMHSTVEGLTDISLSKIIEETFPPASVTGAPKVKAVEVIDQLEPHPRGYYCGCAGLIKPSGDFILSVLIRTAYGQQSELSYYAGCGIVWDSDPESELKELYLKVEAFYKL